MSSTSRPRWVAPGLGVGLALVLAYALIGRSETGRRVAGDLQLWVYTAVSFTAAGAVLWRAHTENSPRERRVWWLIGATVLSWALADLAAEVAYGGEAPDVSPLDAVYLAGYVVLIGALLLAGGSRSRDWRSGLWLDGTAAALTLAALGALLVVQPIRELRPADTANWLVLLAYPVLDILVIAALIAATALREWRVDRRWLVLGVAVAIFAVADSIFTLQLARGTYDDGAVLDAGWMLTYLAFAAAAWTQPLSAPARLSPMVVSLAPLLTGAAAVAILLVDAADGGDPVVAALAVAALGAVLVRSALAIADAHRILAIARDEASTDHLTSLGNRRRLMTDLHDQIVGRVPAVLVIMDLNGFKAYNDRHGHEAGDRLLARVGKSLGAATRDSGCAYRLGGDEFCALVPLVPLEADADADAAREAERIAGAVADAGGPDGVTVAVGHVMLPQEADEPSAALRIADTRMYAAKRGEPSGAR